MQNMDFYNGKSYRNGKSISGGNGTENWTAKKNSKEEMRSRKKASRIIFLIAAMCIISFTTGLAIGIKFAGGAERKIVDEKTFKAVLGLGSRMSSMFDKKSTEKFKQEKFPRDEFPFVIKAAGKLMQVYGDLDILDKVSEQLGSAKGIHLSYGGSVLQMEGDEARDVISKKFEQYGF